MSRGPFQLVLLPQVERESVAPREDLSTNVAFILGHPSNLLFNDKSGLENNILHFEGDREFNKPHELS